MTRRRSSEWWGPSGWWLGCPALLVLWGLSARTFAPRIEADLRTRLLAERANLGGDGPLASQVAVAGRDVAITADPGLAPDVLARVAALARRLPGTRRVATATATPVPLDPYSFSLRRGRSALTLEGGVPSAAARVALLREVASRAPGVALDDRLGPATGAPAGFDAVAADLVGLALELETAEASLTGPIVTFRGVARDQAGYARAREMLAHLPPGFWTGDVAVAPPLVHPWSWSASRRGDQLVLDGFVPSETERGALVAAARGKVREVRDGMQTARGWPDHVDFRAAAQAGLDALARLQDGRAELRDGRATLRGRSAARDLLESTASAFRAALPAELGRPEVALAASPADPYVFAAERKAGRVTLSGYMPQDPERAALRDLAARRFPGEAIVDDVHLADGAPPDVAAAAGLALGQLAQMAEGRVAISGRAYALSGLVLYPELAGRLRERAEAGLPSGWSVSADLRGPAERQLQPQVCGDLLDDALRREPIRFAAGASDLAAGAERGIAAAAAVLARCGPARVRVVASAPEGDAKARELARRRAESVTARLAQTVESGAGLTLASETRERAGPELAFEVESREGRRTDPRADAGPEPRADP